MNKSSESELERYTRALVGGTDPGSLTPAPPRWYLPPAPEELVLEWWTRAHAVSEFVSKSSFLKVKIAFISSFDDKVEKRVDVDIFGNFDRNEPDMLIELCFAS